MRTWFSLCSISIREKPIFITGIPANENMEILHWPGKTLFWPCTGPVRDCSVKMTLFLCTILFAIHILDLFLQGHKPTHVFKTTIVGAD